MEPNQRVRSELGPYCLLPLKYTCRYAADVRSRRHLCTRIMAKLQRILVNVRYKRCRPRYDGAIS